MIVGQRILELRKDGFFVFIGPGDEDFLAWASRGGSDKAININNFVLAESMLVFSWISKTNILRRPILDRATSPLVWVCPS